MDTLPQALSAVSGKSEPIRLTLDLGELALCHAEFLELRPGSALTLELQRSFKGMLRCNGFPLALVDIAINSGELALTVEKFIDIEATFSGNPRDT